jgi:alpha-glucoside transport system substrate-binding protein
MKKLFLMSAAAAALALGSAHAADLKFTPGEGDFNWESYEALKATQLDGEEVTVFGPWLGPDQENVEAVLAYFAEATGADVKYVGSDSFEQQIVIDAEAGSAPNIAVFPQPGLACRHGQPRLPLAAAGRHRRMGQGKLRRRAVLG